VHMDRGRAWGERSIRPFHESPILENVILQQRSHGWLSTRDPPPPTPDPASEVMLAAAELSSKKLKKYLIRVGIPREKVESVRGKAALLLLLEDHQNKHTSRTENRTVPKACPLPPSKQQSLQGLLQIKGDDERVQLLRYIVPVWERAGPVPDASGTDWVDKEGQTRPTTKYNWGGESSQSQLNVNMQVRHDGPGWAGMGLPPSRGTMLHDEVTSRHSMRSIVPRSFSGSRLPTPNISGSYTARALQHSQDSSSQQCRQIQTARAPTTSRHKQERVDLKTVSGQSSWRGAARRHAIPLASECSQNGWQTHWHGQRTPKSLISRGLPHTAADWSDLFQWNPEGENIIPPSPKKQSVRPCPTTTQQVEGNPVQHSSAVAMVANVSFDGDGESMHIWGLGEASVSTQGSIGEGAYLMDSIREEHDSSDAVRNTRIDTAAQQSGAEDSTQQEALDEELSPPIHVEQLDGLQYICPPDFCGGSTDDSRPKMKDRQQNDSKSAQQGEDRKRSQFRAEIQGQAL